MTVDGGPARVVLTTCPDEESARRIAAALVEERLAACVNVVPGIASVFRWEGAVETAGEFLLLVKTRVERLETLAARLTELHPYDVPELLALQVDRGSPEYVRWVVEETQDPP